MIEALLAAVILAMAIMAITMPFSTAVISQHQEIRQTIVTHLAQELMEEILSQPFHDPDGASLPGPEASEVGPRTLYDNVDDYHGLYEPAGQLLDAMGQSIHDDNTYGLSRSVSAEYVYVTGQDISGTPTFIRVRVVVAYQDEPVISLTRLVYDLP